MKFYMQFVLMHEEMNQGDNGISIHTSLNLLGHTKLITWFLGRLHVKYNAC